MPNKLIEQREVVEFQLKVTKFVTMIISKKCSITRFRRFQDFEQGFSIPELLVVLLSISILTVIALPTSIRQLQLYRIETSVSLVSNKLMEARMGAIKRNQTIWLRIDNNTKTIQTKSFNNAAQTIDIDHPERLPQGIILNSSEFVEISFDSMGRSKNGGQFFTIKEINTGKRKDIAVSPSGKITVGQMY